MEPFAKQPFHLLAWYSAALTQNTNNVQINSVADPVYNSRNNNFILPYNLYCPWAAVVGTNATTARFVTGSLGIEGYPHLDQINRAAGEFPTNFGVADFRDWPLFLRSGEDLQATVGNNNGAGTDPAWLGAGVCIDPPVYPTPKVRPHWIRATFTSTLTVGTWSAATTLALEDVIAGGGYDIWGMKCICADASFARLILQGFVHRPGVPAVETAGLVAHPMFSGGLGWFGNFNQYSPPQIELVGHTAGAETGEVELLVTKAP